MSVLIFYQFSNHKQLIDALCYNLNVQGIEADSFNIVSWDYQNHDKSEKLLLPRIFCLVRTMPKVKDLLSRLLLTQILITLSLKYDLVDIHFFSNDYDELINELKQRGKIIKITLWGSDFYRVDETRREQQRKSYLQADIIQIASSQMQNDFLMVYPECADKIRLARFGNIQFKIITELLQKANSEQYKIEMGLPTDKIMLTCGTNGSTGQQHLSILESIEQLADEAKERLFLLVPMTYGGNKDYVETVRQKLISLCLPYKLFASPIPILEICKLRIISDIAITIQITDALSAAILEHIYSGNILIAGKWLPYQNLSEAGIFYLTATLGSLTGTIAKTINYQALLKYNCRNNRIKLADFSSWEKVITNWSAIYNEMIGI
jgi:hypothetical protein